MNRSKRSASGSDQSLNQSKRSGRIKVIPAHFQKSGNSLTSILQAGSYKRKVKELLKRNKDLAVSYQNVKMDLARSNTLLQECSNNNTSILLAKKKLKSLLLTVQELVSGLNEVATCLDMKQFTFLTSTDDEWKLRLPHQALDPIDENNSIVADANLGESDFLVIGNHSGLLKTPVSANLSGDVKVGDNQAEIPSNQPKPVLNASSDSPGTPVLRLSPLPSKCNVFSTDDILEAPPAKRLRTPDKIARTPSPKIYKVLSSRKSPKTGKVLSDSKSPKTHKKTPPKTSPLSSKCSIVSKSPKHSKIPQRKKIPLPEPVIKPPILASSRKTYVIPKDAAITEDVTSTKSPGAEQIILPEIICNDNTNVRGNVASSLRRETFQIPSTTVENSNSVAKVLPLMPNTISSDDMELTAMLPLIKPPEPISCSQPLNDDMELTSVLPSQCFLNNQSTVPPLKQIDPPVQEATGEKTIATDSLVALAPENIILANSIPNPTAKSKKKSLRMKKSLCFKNKEVADLELDENCQPGTKRNSTSSKTKRFSLEDTSLNVTRKSVQFTFNDCYNAFQNIKTKADPPKSILKQVITDCQPSNSRSPECPQKTMHEENKQVLLSLQFSSSDDSCAVQDLSPALFPENGHKNKRPFSGVSERRSKKTVSGDVFSEIGIPEESSPHCLVPSLAELIADPKTVKESDSHTQQNNKSEPLQLNEPEKLAKSPNRRSKIITSEEVLATKPKKTAKVLDSVGPPTVEMDVLIKPPEVTSDNVEPQPKKKSSKGVRKKQKCSGPVAEPLIPKEERNLQVEIETDLISTKESTSLGTQRERRSKAPKSYKEPNLRDKKRRE